MKAVAALLAACVTVGVAAQPAHGAPTITLSGQPIVQSLVADLAYFYRHSVRNPPRFQLTGGGTEAGIADTERGITTGGMVSRALAADDPRDLRLTQLALSGVCLVSNRANPVPNLTAAEVQDLVAARVTNWSQIPGSARTDAIVPVSLAPSTGASRVFESVFIDFDTPIAWQPVTLLTSTQARDYIEQTPAALGYVDLALTGPLHAISYQGIACTRATVGDGTYPAHRPFGVVTRGPPRGALARFLRWARTSRTAKRVISVHYIPA